MQRRAVASMPLPGVLEVSGEHAGDGHRSRPFEGTHRGHALRPGNCPVGDVEPDHRDRGSG